MIKTNDFKDDASSAYADPAMRERVLVSATDSPGVACDFLGVAQRLKKEGDALWNQKQFIAAQEKYIFWNEFITKHSKNALYC